MADTFEDFVRNERERLKQKRGEIEARAKTIQGELDAIDSEMIAIQAYEDAKKGKRSSSGPRAPRGARRNEILDVVTNNPDGIGRSDILEALGVKGDKSGEQSVSNALSALKKAGNIDSRDGKYVVT